MTEGRSLVLLRHGKSDYPGAVRDHDRPLAPRGRREAALAGALLAGLRPPIEAVLCSTALRTRQTLAATGIGAPVTFSDDIYDASPGEILQAIAGTDDRIRTLLVVGHAPGMPGTALALADSRGHGTDGFGGDSDSDSEHLAQLRSHFPTSAFAVLRVPAGWAELGDTGATLVDFVIPRG
ncbi:SixA phosphatase family protein [Nakamurella lactea]|uniref:SixA phosphatase family protein n=1 Tax=Nakamurella lactea TaxID=459515 RepID=UPI0003FF769C|nr:histidine phosphatase family protein [Nakamurella lactea]